MVHSVHPKEFGVPFHNGMSNFEWYRPYWTEKNSEWRLAHTLYTTYIIDQCEYSDVPRIPKVIHQIWIGSPLPDRYIPLIESWKYHHPDWVHILWTDADIEALDLVNKAQYEASTNYGQKADIARYEILYRFGGVYVDIDFECLRPFDIFHHCCDYYTGVAYSGRFCVFNGLIGAAAKNPIIKGCIDTLDISVHYEGSSEHNILFTTGPFHQARNFIAHAHEAGRVVAFPVNYFYPWPFSKKEDTRNLEKWYRPETFAIHYWHAGWRQEEQKKGPNEVLSYLLCTILLH
jgi:mannosyltransferase OCH1-like enzyme